MAVLEKEIATIRLFNEKAEKLKNSRFIQTLLAGENSITMSFSQDEGFKSERRGPDAEAIDAFTLTYRFFVQDREPCSLRNMARMYPTLPVEQDLIDRFLEIRNGINQQLGSPTSVQVRSKDTKVTKAFTHSEVIDTFMNGDLAHANNEQARARFETWRSMPPLFAMAQFTFVNTFMTVTHGILCIREINIEVLDQVARQPVSQGN